MSTTPLISASELSEYIKSDPGKAVICDCRFDLGDPAKGLQQYQAGHIPGAVHIDLDKVMSTKGPATAGRHPLPSREDFAAAMAKAGVGDDTLVICYDAGESMYAARLWWMLRWIGHSNVKVLDGGYAAWLAAGGASSTDAAPARPAQKLSVREPLVEMVDYDTVHANLEGREWLVIDARSPDRFRGENETIDPIGGHIPGAVNRFFKDNLGADGRFKSPEALREDFASRTGGHETGRIINQCGSGVTACHNLLAMEVAGLRGAALYPGSWSQWCNTPGSPIAK